MGGISAFTYIASNLLDRSTAVAALQAYVVLGVPHMLYPTLACVHVRQVSAYEVQECPRV